MKRDQKLSEPERKREDGGNFAKRSSPSHTGPSLNLEDIQIHLAEGCFALENQNSRGPEVSDCSETEKLRYQINHAHKEENGNSTARRRRKIGVVDASDTMFVAARRNLRVLQKKFGDGDGMISETPGIFNKKL